MYGSYFHVYTRHVLAYTVLCKCALPNSACVGVQDLEVYFYIKTFLFVLCVYYFITSGHMWVWEQESG